MRQTPKRPSPAASPAVTTEPSTGSKTKKPANAPLFAFARQVFAQVSDSLEGHFEQFLEFSSIEDQRLMIEILRDHDNRGPGSSSLRDYEVPLYSAIQRQLDNCICVSLPDDDMLPLVNEFIVVSAKGAAGSKIMWPQLPRPRK